MAEVSSSLFLQLPPEMICEVFTHVPVFDVGNIRAVCKDFNKHTEYPQLWNVFAASLGVQASPDKSVEKAVKDEVIAILFHRHLWKNRPRITYCSPPPPRPPRFPEFPEFPPFSPPPKLPDHLLLRERFPDLFDHNRIHKKMIKHLIKEMSKIELVPRSILLPELDRRDFQLPELQVMVQRKSIAQEIGESIEKVATHVVKTVANFFRSLFG
jgi:hypothetical protein